MGSAARASVRRQRARWSGASMHRLGLRLAAGVGGQRAALGEGAARRQVDRSGGAPPMVSSRAPLASAPWARLFSSASV
jgi:hypothetical protein